MTRFLSRFILALGLCTLASPALAQANLAINANVLKSCKVSDAAPAITINYDLFDAATATGSASFGVRCTKDTTIQVSASAGSNGGAGGFLRSVTDGTDSLGYELALAAPGTELAIDIATNVGPSAGRAVDVPVTFHATLDQNPANDVAAGAYTDTVVLTFTAL